MSGLSVIIPSKTESNLVACINAGRECDPAARYIVVNDGIQPSDREAFREWDRQAKPHWQTGIKPFVFSRNVNIGIRAAKTDDVVLLNDDALLRSAGGFSALREAAKRNPEYGVISATTNYAGNIEQRYQGIGLRDAGNRCVAFVCVLIPRRTIDLVGLLDERYTGYGWEDNDYCRRVRNAGLKVGILDDCYVDHGSLQSTYRGDPRAAADIAPGAAIYMAKWGDLN